MPRSFREHVGHVFAACFCALFVGFFTELAVRHLRNFASTPVIALIAAVLWLLLVLFGVWTGLTETRGIGGFLAGLLGAFARDQFVDVVAQGGKAAGTLRAPARLRPGRSRWSLTSCQDTGRCSSAAQASGRRILRYGFRLFGLALYYEKVPLDRITLAEWSPGQATSLAGRDMDDWHVTVWYKPEPPQKPRFPASFRLEEDLFIVGPCGPKDKTAAFGRDLVELLIAAGLPMTQGKDDCRFVPAEEKGKTSSDNTPDQGGRSGGNQVEL